VHNIGVFEVAQQTGLGEKFFDNVGVHASEQNFDGSFGFEVEVTAQINVGKATLAENM
jgi:hypothetical protein